MRIKIRLERFYRHRETPILEVFAICECVDGHVYYQHTDGMGELEHVPYQQFYADFERIQD